MNRAALVTGDGAAATNTTKRAKNAMRDLKIPSMTVSRSVTIEGKRVDCSVRANKEERKTAGWIPSWTEREKGMGL